MHICLNIAIRVLYCIISRRQRGSYVYAASERGAHAHADPVLVARAALVPGGLLPEPLLDAAAARLLAAVPPRGQTGPPLAHRSGVPASQWYARTYSGSHTSTVYVRLSKYSYEYTCFVIPTR